MIVLDAGVLIGYLDRNDAHHSRANTLLAREIDDEFAVNSLTLAEVLVGPIREDRLADVQATLGDLEVRELRWPPESAVKLARIRAGTALRMPDCCVLLAAEESGARVATFDHRLADVAAARNLVVVRD